MKDCLLVGFVSTTTNITLKYNEELLIPLLQEFVDTCKSKKRKNMSKYSAIIDFYAESDMAIVKDVMAEYELKIHFNEEYFFAGQLDSYDLMNVLRDFVNFLIYDFEEND